MRYGPGRVVLGAQAQIFVHAIRVDDLVGIHLPAGVPDCLELTKRLHQFGAIHLGQQLRTRLAIPMLSGQRATIANHQVGGFFHEGAKLFDPVTSQQIKVDTRMDAALAKVTIQRSVIAITAEQLEQVAQVISQLCWRHGRVLPAFPARRLIGHEDGGRQAGFAHCPDPGRLPGIGEELHRWRIRCALEFLH